jgi:hypothetical protein
MSQKCEADIGSLSVAGGLYSITVAAVSHNYSSDAQRFITYTGNYAIPYVPLFMHTFAPTAVSCISRRIAHFIYLKLKGVLLILFHPGHISLVSTSDLAAGLYWENMARGRATK